MRILVDTNILTRLAQPAHRDHVHTRDSLERLRSAGHEPCVVPQVVYEFWVVGTRPLAAHGLGMTVPEVQAEVVRVKLLFPLYRDERAIFPR